SAGSGKTAVLTGRVADIISNSDNSIDRLLIVTFTNAAAAEMKDRIEKRIRELLTENPYGANSTHLKRQLRLLNSADVTTIDAFCGRLVRKFFYKTDIAPNFAVDPGSRLREIRDEAMARVMEDAFKKMEEGEELYAPLYDLCDILTDGRSNRLELEEAVIYVSDKLSSLPCPEEWIRDKRKEVSADRCERYLELRRHKIIHEGMELKRAAELIGEADRILYEYIPAENGGNFLEEEKEYIEALAEEKDILKLTKQLNGIKFPTWSGKIKKYDPEMGAEAQKLRNKAKDIITKKAKPQTRYFTVEAFEEYKKQLPFLNLFYTLVEEFRAEYYKLKSEKNMYEFNDIERACLNMLISEDGCETETAVYLKNKYIEIMTDEYQDTNPLQEALLSALSGDKNRFMVGDIKQSIYRFRDADINIFADKYNRYYDEEKENKESNNSLVRLNENYRSVPEVLDFVNLVFSKIMTKDLGGAEYEPLRAKNAELIKLPRHKVQISILNRSTGLRLDDRLISEETPLLEAAAESAGTAEALLIAGKIKELMKEDSSVKFGDIVILMRTTAGISDEYIEVLERCGIPALTTKPADSTNFIENKIIISYLKVIDNPLSDIDLVTVLHSPIYRITAEELGIIKCKSKDKFASYYGLIWDYAEAYEDEISKKLKVFLEDRKYFEERFKTEPVNSVLSEMYTKTDYYSYLNVMTDSGKRRANLDKLLDMGADYDETSQGGLYGFIKYLDSVTEGGEFKQAQLLSAENDAVRIMTIHGSKGLQFPVVFISQVQKQFNKLDKGDKVIFDRDLGVCMPDFDPENRVLYDTEFHEAAIINNNRKDIAETVRQYYVAMTRAEKRLYITASEAFPKREKAGEEDTYEDQLQRLKDKYENPLDAAEGKEISAEAVYSAKSFLPVLMTAVNMENNRELKDAFDVEYLQWYELGGIFENSGHEVYNKELKTTKLEKAEYPYKAFIELPTNLSVTEIKKEANEEEYTMNYAPRPFVLKKPKFLKKPSDALSPMEQGTAYHTLLSALDYNNPPFDAEEFKAEAVRKGLLTEQEGSSVKAEKIDAYIKSPIFERAAKALYVKKEHSFTMGLPAEELYPDIKKTVGEEIILTHGIIDMFFEEEDGIVIVDFKTDKIKDDEKLKKMYYPQLSVYKTAVEEATGKKVKEIYLYLVVREKTLAL
ncbi:MAG: helicase-exonuclease AddAB subunit AddA, partial [Eubacterium sp.]|nr:helicase-exonuclease AddAB subunit AddA [Eubacterium sp.]